MPIAARSHMLAAALPVTLLMLSCLANVADLAAAEEDHTAGGPDTPEFVRDVAPILREHCIRCHQPGNAKGDFSLATWSDVERSGYVVPGDPDSSYLLDLVTPAAPDERPEMPQDGESLEPAERETLRRWIDAGAAWPADHAIREASKADTSWWSLQPLSEAVPPELPEAPQAWTQHPIDRFVYARLAAAGLTPSPPADKRTLIRRVTYDLTGLPPTPEEVRAFQQDTSPDAWQQLIDRLLASPHYGEHWGRHWLDVVRFGESNGFERNQIINNAWPFRDYVIRAFNEDRPFDQFALEHLAGDVIGPDVPEIAAGTTFLVCGPYDDVGNQDPKQAAQIRANTIDDIIRATGETFLGLTIGCARCHDHKFDPVLQEDYYSLYATFAGVQHGSREVSTAAERESRRARLQPLQQQQERLRQSQHALDKQILQRGEARLAEHEAAWPRPPIDRKRTEERFSPTEARMVRLVVEGTENNPAGRSGYHIDEFEVWTADPEPRNVAAAAEGGQATGASRVAEDFADAYSAELTIDGQFGARWIASGPELTITFTRPELVERVVFSSDRPGAAGSHGVASFVCEYRVLASLDGEQWTEVANSYDRQPIHAAHRRRRLMDAEITREERARQRELARDLAVVQKKIAEVPPLPSWWVGNFQQAAGPFHVFLGGDPQRPGATVDAASLSACGETCPGYRLPADASEGERRRALAEWITDPANPLTPRVLANRIWHYHFGTGIVDTPSDFGYMGGRPTHPALLDWLASQLLQNGWRWKPLHRLILTSQTYRQASAWRDEAFRVDGDSRLLWRFPPRRLSAEEIRDTMLAVSGTLDRTAGGPGFRLYRYIQDNVATYLPRDEHGPDTYRRAVYHQNARAALIDLLTEFDCPDSAFPAPRRATTTTPLQALTLLNHAFTNEMAVALAKRLRREAGDDLAKQVRQAFWQVLLRPPDPQEAAAATELVEHHGLPAFCRVLWNTNELIYLD